MNGALVIAAFLLGSIPFGLFFAKARGVDIQAVGSGNIGATNVSRSVGKREGALTLACDLAKGLLPALVARLAGFPPGWLATVCLAAVLGHIYSPWLRFRGGKGVATGAGAFLAAAPAATLICGLTFLIGLKFSQRVSVGSLLCTAFLPVVLWALGHAPQMTAGGGIAVFFVILRHKENLHRLWTRTEPKLGSS